MKYGEWKYYGNCHTWIYMWQIQKRGGRHENVRVLRKEIKKVLRWESGWMWRWSNKKGFEYDEQRKVTMNGKKREQKYENKGY